MKSKINMRLIGIAVISILATLVLTSAAFYKLFCEQVYAELKTYCELLEKGSSEEFLTETIPRANKDLRITIIGADGEVEYDNVAESVTMENHGKRPEILEAKKDGAAKEIRKSTTLGKSVFYYAKLMEDGRIIRVAKDTESLLGVFGNAIPMVIVIILVLLVSCFVIAHFLTKSLINPVKAVAGNLDQMDEVEFYEELQPFISTIRAQHEDILKNARVRQDFTANVTHELKTPLTSISGYAELIETGMASDADVIRFAAGIHKNSNRLLTLINDIIRLSELDSGTQEEAFEEINLYALAQTCVDMMQINAEKHSVKLFLTGKECYVFGNKQMLEEVLYNLCENAIRYNNENGKVIVDVTEQENKTLLIVKDTGIGIPKECQERVFERFYRVDKSRSKSTGGTGLGLAIVKHIVMKLGATIDLESEVGKGTKITVTFY